MRADVIYDAGRSHFKIVPVGSPAGAVTLLSLTGVRMDQLTEQPVQAWSSFRGGNGSPLRTWVRNRLSPESF